MTGQFPWLRNHWPRVTPETLRLDRHCLPLDGVRGLAVLLVLCYDCLKLAPGPDIFTLGVRRLAASGWVGVDLFFVLSGFLITGVLLETRGRVGYWKSFFLRRSVRIFPLYYGTLFGVFIAIPAILWLLGSSPAVQVPFAEAREHQLWYWLYAQNWLFAWQQAWPGGIPIKHFWSLAIEEQFYLVWPLAVALSPRRQLGWVCLILGVLSLSLRVCLLTHDFPPMMCHVMTITRLDGLCCGAGMAIALRSPGVRNRLAVWLPSLAVAALLGLACVDLIIPILKSETFAAYTIGHTLTAITFALLIGAAQCVSPQHLIARAFSWKCLTTLGTYSYAIYVFHHFVNRGVRQFDWSVVPDPWRAWLIFFCVLGGSLLAAQISWVLIERPCLSLKKYFPRPDSPRDRSSHSSEQTKPSQCGQVKSSQPVSF